MPYTHQPHTQADREIKPVTQTDLTPPSPETAETLPLLVQRTYAMPALLRPPQVQTLQRLVGNRAVTRLLAGHADVQPQRQSAAEAGFEAGDDFEAHLTRARTGGNPLPEAVRADLEPKFGADFSGVRIHTGPQAARLNRQIQAKAFTLGRDIYFGAGAYTPETGAGKQLIAHELTHTIQQTGGKTIQRALTPPQQQALKRKLGQNKYTKVEQAGKLDYFHTLDDGDLEAYRLMRNDQFDQLLPTLGQSGQRTQGQTGQPPQGGLVSKLTDMAKSLFGKLWAGVTALANSLSFSIESESLVSKLISSLAGKFKLKMTTESLEMGVSELAIPIGPLANLEFGLEGKAELKEDKDESLLEKLKGGASLDDLNEGLLRGLAAKVLEKVEKKYPEQTKNVKEKATTSMDKASEKTQKLFSKASQLTGPKAKKVLKEAYAKSSTSMSFVKFMGSLAEGGGLKFFQSTGSKLAVAGKGSARFKVGLGWLKDLVSNLIGGPLQDIEAFAKDYLFGTDTAQSEGWGSWTWGLAKGVGSAVGTGIDYATLGLASKMVQGVSSGVAWLGQKVLPQSVLDVLAALGEITSGGFNEWLKERLKFIEKLDPSNQLPTLGLSLEGQGKYKGMGQVEDMEGDVKLDLSAPESYIGTWLNTLTDALAKTATGWKQTAAEVLKAVTGALSGQVTLFGFKNFSLSWQKGRGGLLPNFEAGPALRWMINAVSAVVQAIKSGIRRIFP